MPETGPETLQPPSALESRPGGDWKGPLARLVGIAVSSGLLIGLYRSIDMRLVGEALRSPHPVWLIVSVSVIAPITFLRAVRFLIVAPPGALPGIGEALRLTLVASAFNVFLPAKTGDLVKSYFVVKRGGVSRGIAVAIVVYERLCDLFSLIFWCMAGWLISRPVVTSVPAAMWPLLGAVGAACGIMIASRRAAGFSYRTLARAMPHRKLQALRDMAAGWPDLLHRLKGRRRWVLVFSLFLWLVHLIQIWMFTRALEVPIPFMVCASLTAVALMAGQLPFTIAGLGARDVALVVLLSGYMTREAAAALGILMLSRNVLPPLAGLTIMRPYLTVVVERARMWRQDTTES